MKTYLRSSSDSQASEDDEVVAWRRRCLLLASFDVPLADELAHIRAVDLHAVLDLVERGCPPELAARILAPLEPPGAEADD